MPRHPPPVRASTRAVKQSGNRPGQEFPVVRSAASRALGIHELLSTIFMHCLNEEEEEEETNEYCSWTLKFSADRRYLRPSEKEAPLLVAHVCRDWRNVTLSTPSLWARLHLEIARETCTDPTRLEILEKQLSALEFWLSNSRSVPISVRIRFTWQWGVNPFWHFSHVLGHNPSTSPTVLVSMVETLYKHIHRWENIEILLPKIAIVPFYSNIDQQYPHLLSLKVGNDPFPCRVRFVGRNLFLHSAPKMGELALTGRNSGGSGDIFAPEHLPESLHSLELSHLTFYITPSMHGCHLRQLSLRDVRIPANIFSWFPETFPFLETLILDYKRQIFPIGADSGSDDENTNNDHNFVVLDHLTTLKIRLRSLLYHLLSPPLESLTTPALTHLALFLGVGYDNDIIQFLQRTQAPVKYFVYESERSIGYDDCEPRDPDREVYYSLPSDEKLVVMLKAMPDLEELRVYEPALSQTMQYLRDPAHLPRLRTLFNVGVLKTTNISDGSPLELSGPASSDILTLIRTRCRKREAPPAIQKNRNWLEKLALPVHDACERAIRRKPIFRQAVLAFKSTHECEDESKDEEDSDWY